MKANELMIGDWVRIKSDIEPDDAYWLHNMQPGQALKVTEILSYGINPDWYGGEINDCVPEDAIESIPITPEILEKNGFEKQEFDGWLLGKQMGNDLAWLILWRTDCLSPHLQIDSYSSQTGSFSSFAVNYVHQLQHALRLCGIEKEITL